MHMGKRKFNYIHASNLHNLLERDFWDAAVILQNVSSGLSGDAKDTEIIKALGSTIQRQVCFHYYYCQAAELCFIVLGMQIKCRTFVHSEAHEL